MKNKKSIIHQRNIVRVFVFKDLLISAKQPTYYETLRSPLLNIITTKHHITQGIYEKEAYNRIGNIKRLQSPIEMLKKV